MEILVIILIGLAVYGLVAAPLKRRKHTAKCPKCGTVCNASPWANGQYFEAQYKCPHCGYKFTEHYTKL